LLITTGIAECRVLPLADEKIDTDGFARAVIDKEHFRLPHKYWLAA